MYRSFTNRCSVDYASQGFLNFGMGIDLQRRHVAKSHVWHVATCGVSHLSGVTYDAYHTMTCDALLWHVTQCYDMSYTPAIIHSSPYIHQTHTRTRARARTRTHTHTPTHTYLCVCIYRQTLRHKDANAMYGVKTQMHCMCRVSPMHCVSCITHSKCIVCVVYHT